MAATDIALTASPERLHAPATARRWLVLVAILLLGLAVRAPMLTDAAFPIDLVHFARWMNQIEDEGLTQFYNPALRMGSWDRPYPPLPTLLFGAMLPVVGTAPEPNTSLNDPAFVILLKLLPLASELAIIAVAAIWLRKTNTRLWWAIPVALAVYPGLIVTTAWWGQYDAPFTLFLLLALVALNRDRPVWAWVWFAVALLTKQPAATLGPLLLVITLRRYGWRTLLTGMAACAGLYALASLPFVLGSGLEATLSPYLKASDAFPYLTNNAYNSWYAAAALYKGDQVLFMEAQFRDSLPLLGGLTAKTVGVGLFGLYVLALCAFVWRHANERRELVWAAALYVGFFMLPTQVHERYLYPAVVFGLVGIAQDRGLLCPSVGLMLTFSYNVLAVAVPSRWPDAHLAPDVVALPVALINIVLLALVTRVALAREPLAARVAHPDRLRVTTQTLPTVPPQGS